MLGSVLAITAYAATLVLGTLSARGVRVPRVWHSRMFVVTAVVTVVAAATSMGQSWLRGALLLMALVPLGLLPFITTPVSRHPRRHALVGLAAAPFYLAALAHVFFV